MYLARVTFANVSCVA